MMDERPAAVWNGAAEILAAVKNVPAEHRFDAFALASAAFIQTKGTLAVRDALKAEVAKWGRQSNEMTKRAMIAEAEVNRLRVALKEDNDSNIHIPDGTEGS